MGEERVTGESKDAQYNEVIPINQISTNKKINHKY
jgi:hypothetical protein